MGLIAKVTDMHSILLIPVTGGICPIFTQATMLCKDLCCWVLYPCCFLCVFKGCVIV